ncbi:MAG: glycerate kinase [Ginsengibacter sp.]
MHILIAPNSFKDSLNAEDTAIAIKEGLNQSKLKCTCECFPIGDGGDGTGMLIIKKCAGEFVSTTTQDALGRKINAQYGLIENGKTAVIEMADTSGIRLLKSDELEPLSATSFGTGQQIKAALNKGVTKIIIGMGGSATVDGGTGILKALGIHFLNEQGNELVMLPSDLIHLDSIDLSGLDERIMKCELIILCDVENRLLGEQGAAAVFGPQKGATERDVKMLEAALEKLTQVAIKQTGRDMSTVKYGGTAGGAAAGLHVFLNAQLINGIDYFLQLTDFSSSIENADIVITGEGSIDEQTLQGKGPFGVATIAKKNGIPVIGLAGKVPLKQNNNLQKYFDVLMSIGNQPSGLAEALTSTEANLVRTSRDLGNLLSLRFPKDSY